jgi:hypothetical protein
MQQWGAWLMDRLLRLLPGYLPSPTDQAVRLRIEREQQRFESELHTLHEQRHAEERRLAWEERGRPDG